MESDKALIDGLIKEGNQFNWKNFCQADAIYPGQYGGTDTPEWLAWKTRTTNAVERICSDSAPARKLTDKAAVTATKGFGPKNFENVHSSLLKALALTRSALDSDEYGELRGPTSTHTSPSLSNRVFVVHGHDSALKTDVEGFLHQIGLEPVVLHREIDQGATLIEKFEKHSDVGFAIVLLTPDEVAYTIDQESVPLEERLLEGRARPNVIFEFGYFVGRLGRPRVCCLYKEGVSIPSDLNGLLYKKIENAVEEQAFGIIRELKAAGYDVKI